MSAFLYQGAFLLKSFYQSQNVTREKLHKALLYEKSTRKMLMKLTPAGYLDQHFMSSFYECFAQLFFYLQFGFCKFLAKIYWYKSCS